MWPVAVVPRVVISATGIAPPLVLTIDFLLWLLPCYEVLRPALFTPPIGVIASWTNGGTLYMFLAMEAEL
jgi:hypothetical protein